MSEYQLSAGAILYALFRMRKTGIYGVPRAMPSRQDREFPVFAQEAERELMDKGCATMDFDGVFTLDTDFARMLGQCADCTRVMGLSLHRNGAWQRFTGYLSAGVLLCRNEELACVIRDQVDPAKEILRELKLPGHEKTEMPELLVDTRPLELRDLTGLISAGYSEAQARMILASLDGAGGYAHITGTRDQRRLAEALLLYGREGILSAAAEYTETQELLRMKPLTTAEAEALVGAIAEAACEEED